MDKYTAGRQSDDDKIARRDHSNPLRPLASIKDTTSVQPDHMILLNETSPLLELSNNGTPVQSASHTTRSVHMQPHLVVGRAQHFGTFYTEYDPMTGARTAVILGSCLLVLVFYIVYKAKCHKAWTSEDDLYLQQYKRQHQEKFPNQTGRRSTSYVIDPVCHPDPNALAATAQWVKLQPLENSMPEGLPVERRRSRFALSKFPSISAENINYHFLHTPPPVPNGRLLDSPDLVIMPNEFVPNGILKNVNKDRRSSNMDVIDGTSRLSSDSFTAPQPSQYLTVHGQKYDAIQMLQLPLPAPDLQVPAGCEIGPNSDGDTGERRQRFQPTVSMEVNVETCTKCNASHGCSCNNMTFDLGSSLALPQRPDIMWTPTPKRSKLQINTRPSSYDDAQMETTFSLSPVPRLALAPDLGLPVDEPPLFPRLVVQPDDLPILSIIDNLASNANDSTQSTATASTAGSFGSDSTHIPLTDFKLPRVTNVANPVQTTADYSREPVGTHSSSTSSKIRSEKVTSL